MFTDATAAEKAELEALDAEIANHVQAARDSTAKLLTVEARIRAAHGLAPTERIVRGALAADEAQRQAIAASMGRSLDLFKARIPGRSLSRQPPTDLTGPKVPSPVSPSLAVRAKPGPKPKAKTQ